MEYDSIVRMALCREFENYKLNVVWWNTGMSALLRKLRRVGCDSAAEKQKLKCALSIREAVVRKLILRSDILVLGEYVNAFGLNGDLVQINQKLRMEGVKTVYDIVDLKYNVSDQMMFDNLIVYDRSKLFYVPQNVVEMSVCNIGTRRRVRRYKAYQRVKFDDRLKIGKSFDVFVVHWGMRDGFGGEDLRKARLKAAELLSKEVEPSKRRSMKIVVGDFNNEPYEAGMYWLESSRSRKYVSEVGGLYNPFWRFLGEELHTIYSPKNHEFLSDGAIFDGILVNSAFVGRKDGWQLEPRILNGLYNMNTHDHTPVQLTLSH